jgi:superfamily I DNA/RNA helicase
MIYLPATIEDIQFKQYDEVFVDEIQDIGLVHKSMIEKILKKNSRFILVGDEFQSIYEFMSANPEVFKSFQNRPNTISLPLSISYRCAKNIVKKANTVFDITEPFENNPDGEVRDGSINEVQSGDFVLCRNNQPLIEAYLHFLVQGKKAHIKGRDLGESLLKLVSKIEDKSYSEGKGFLRELLSEVIQDLKKSNVQNPFKHPRYVALKEKVDIIFVLLDKYMTFDALEKALKEMFVDDVRDGIMLSTIHRSKGLEANNVFVLKHELLPSPYAEKEWELSQEQNLRYVLYTRARNKLIFITDF